MHRLELSDSEKLQSLQGAEPQDAACRSELDLFDSLAGKRTKKEDRAKAAAICGGCTLRSRCGFRVVPRRKRTRMSDVSNRVEKFIAAFGERVERSKNADGTAGIGSNIISVLTDDDEKESVLLFSDLVDVYRAYSLVAQVRAQDITDEPAGKDSAGS